VSPGPLYQLHQSSESLKFNHEGQHFSLYYSFLPKMTDKSDIHSKDICSNLTCIVNKCLYLCSVVGDVIRDVEPVKNTNHFFCYSVYLKEKI